MLVRGPRRSAVGRRPKKKRRGGRFEKNQKQIPTKDAARSNIPRRAVAVKRKRGERQRVRKKTGEGTKAKRDDRFSDLAPNRSKRCRNGRGCISDQEHQEYRSRLAAGRKQRFSTSIAKSKGRRRESDNGGGRD